MILLFQTPVSHDGLWARPCRVHDGLHVIRYGTDSRADLLLSDARHEAAHAVVSVRLGLPLAYTCIGMDPSRPRYGVSVDTVSVGYTSLEEGCGEAWRAALPDETARKALESLAVQTAAGIVADLDEGLPLGHVSHAEDMEGIIQIAGVLGFDLSTSEPAVQAFMRNAFVRATLILSQDDGAAWNRVCAALVKRRRLTGALVAALTE